MQHSYDLVFQSKQVGEAVVLQGVIAALTARGAAVSAEGRGVWKLDKGEVNVSPMTDGPKVLGLDVRVPFREKTELLEQVLQAMVDVAEATGLRVMDPQRGDEATLTTASSVSDEYLRMARYAGEYGAVSEALGLSSYVRPTTEPDSSPFRWIMIFAVFAVAIYVGYRAMTLHRTDEPPRPVNGPPKIGGE